MNACLGVGRLWHLGLDLLMNVFYPVLYIGRDVEFSRMKACQDPGACMKASTRLLLVAGRMELPLLRACWRLAFLWELLSNINKLKEVKICH